MQPLHVGAHLNIGDTPNHAFSPVGALGGGQEMRALDLPLPGASPLTPVVPSDFQRGETFWAWLCHRCVVLGQCAVRGLDTQTLHMLEVFRTDPGPASEKQLLIRTVNVINVIYCGGLGPHSISPTSEGWTGDCMVRASHVGTTSLYD